MKSDKILKKQLLLYGATEQEADNFIEDLAKLPDEVEEQVKETVVEEKEFNKPEEADRGVEKEFNDPKEAETFGESEKEFN